MDGILIIDKPAGITSHDVVARCRRILKMKRIGHTGTLDPFATGVMVVLVGQATRLAQFLDKDRKEYEALVRFGFETDTGDRTGRPKESAISNLKFEISNKELEEALEDFRGPIEQTPPMYSAKKIDGQKLYELARKGLEVERKAVPVTIFALEMMEEAKGKGDEETRGRGDEENLENSVSKSETGESQDSGLKTQDYELKTQDSRLLTLDFPVRVACSAGTYIRVLAEDIGKKLNTGAHLAELRRTRAGKFGIERAVTLERLEEMAAENKVGAILVSMNEAVSHLPSVVLNEAEIAKTRNGIKLRWASDEIEDGQAVRLVDENTNLIAVGFYKSAEKFVQPKIVLV